DPVGVGAAADVAALAVQRPPQRRGQLGDVVGEQEVWLLGDEQALDVDPRWMMAVGAGEDVTVLGGLQQGFAAVTQEKVLSRLNVGIFDATERDIGAGLPRI